MLRAVRASDGRGATAEKGPASWLEISRAVTRELCSREAPITTLGEGHRERQRVVGEVLLAGHALDCGLDGIGAAGWSLRERHLAGGCLARDRLGDRGLATDHGAVDRHLTDDVGLIVAPAVGEVERERRR